MSSSSDFYILGMNIGADQRDYTFLHHTIPTSRNDTVGSLADEYQKNIEQMEGLPPESNELDRLAQKKQAIEEKLFYLLEQERSPQFDPQNPLIAELVFNKGLDILEARINNPKFEELIKNHEPKLHAALKKRVKNRGSQTI